MVTGDRIAYQAIIIRITLHYPLFTMISKPYHTHSTNEINDKVIQLNTSHRALVLLKSALNEMIVLNEINWDNQKIVYDINLFDTGMQLYGQITLLTDHDRAFDKWL